MKQVIFKGEAVNLGRFGLAQPGQTLLLTTKEAEDVEGDPRFKFVRDFDPSEVDESDALSILKLEVQQLDIAELDQRVQTLIELGRLPGFQFRSADRRQKVLAVLEATGLSGAHGMLLEGSEPEVSHTHLDGGSTPPPAPTEPEPVKPKARRRRA